MRTTQIANGSFGRCVVRAKNIGENSYRTHSADLAPTTFKYPKNVTSYDVCEIIRIICNLSSTLLTFSQKSCDRFTRRCGLGTTESLGGAQFPRHFGSA